MVNGTLGSIGRCSSKLIFAPATALVGGVETTFPGFENGPPSPIPLIKIKDLSKQILSLLGIPSCNDLRNPGILVGRLRLQTVWIAFHAAGK